jgi:hypothetical protein
VCFEKRVACRARSLDGVVADDVAVLVVRDPDERDVDTSMMTVNQKLRC